MVPRQEMLLCGIGKKWQAWKVCHYTEIWDTVDGTSFASGGAILEILLQKELAEYFAIFIYCFCQKRRQIEFRCDSVACKVKFDFLKCFPIIFMTEALNSFIESKMFMVVQNLDCFPTEAVGLCCLDGYGGGGRGGGGTRQHFRHSQVIPSFCQ